MDTHDPPSEDVRVRRAAVPLLALTVGFVLADSAIVMLALPEILRRLGGTVPQVAWVLIAFNLVLALVVVPAAWVCVRRDPAPLCAAGIAVFAGASAACALAVMKTTTQASATVMRFCLRAEVFTKAGVHLVFIGFNFFICRLPKCRKRFGISGNDC